jgi:hypothetical protein
MVTVAGTRPAAGRRNVSHRSAVHGPSYIGTGVRIPSESVSAFRRNTQCEAVGARQVVAVIGDSRNTGSIALHAKAGFAHARTMKSVGFKLGRWVDGLARVR